MEIIKKLFGPFKEEIWQEIAHEYEGVFIKGGWFEEDVVKIELNGWEIILDTIVRGGGNKTKRRYTRIRSPFINKDELYFKIYREGFFNSLAKYFGMQDLQIGDEQFDKTFLIKGNDIFKITWICESPGMQRLFYAVDDLHIEIRSDEGVFTQNYKTGMDELYFEVAYVLKDKDQLRTIFDLFAMTLEKITELDSGYA